MILVDLRRWLFSYYYFFDIRGGAATAVMLYNSLLTPRTIAVPLYFVARRCMVWYGRYRRFKSVAISPVCCHGAKRLHLWLAACLYGGIRVFISALPVSSLSPKPRTLTVTVFYGTGVLYFARRAGAIGGVISMNSAAFFVHAVVPHILLALFTAATAVPHAARLARTSFRAFYLVFAGLFLTAGLPAAVTTPR